MKELFEFFGHLNALLGLGAIIAAIVLLRWKVPQIKSEAAIRSLDEHRKMLEDADKRAAGQRDELKIMSARIRHLEELDAQRREEEILKDAALTAYRRYVREVVTECQRSGGKVPPKDELLRRIEEQL